MGSMFLPGAGQRGRSTDGGLAPGVMVCGRRGLGRGTVAAAVVAELLPLIDEELTRMGASAEEARGCGCYDCAVCNPPRCERCGEAACAAG